jgi:putative transposase
VLIDYVQHYNANRTHRSLDQRAPLDKPNLEAPAPHVDVHHLLRRDRLGGLIHECEVAA